MRLSLKQTNKSINYIIFMAVFFLQAYVDGRYIAYGQEPTVLKVLKYGLVAFGILWGMIQIFNRRNLVFVKELSNILLAIFVFIVVSLALILVRNGNLTVFLELIIRYSMSILYAFVLLNVMDFDDIYHLMTYALFVSLFGFFMEVGEALMDGSLYARISFRDSFSPFESSFFAAPAVNCCAFFMYYRRKKLITVIAFLFVLFTFKRPQIVFSIVFLVLPLFVDPNRRIKKTTHFFLCVGTIVFAVLWYYLMLPENEWIIEKLTNQSAEAFTSGRSNILRGVVSSDYRMGGLGSSDFVMSRSIEMDLIVFMVEMSLPVMALFVFCFASISGRRVYAVVVMIYRLFAAITGSGFYNITGMVLLYLIFGSINYLQPDTLRKRNGSK